MDDVGAEQCVQVQMSSSHPMMERLRSSSSPLVGERRELMSSPVPGM